MEVGDAWGPSRFQGGSTCGRSRGANPALWWGHAEMSQHHPKPWGLGTARPLKSLPGPQALVAQSVKPTGYLLLLLCVSSLTRMKEQGPGVRAAQVHTLPP